MFFVNYFHTLSLHWHLFHSNNSDNDDDIASAFTVSICWQFPFYVWSLESSHLCRSPSAHCPSCDIHIRGSAHESCQVVITKHWCHNHLLLLSSVSCDLERNSSSVSRGLILSLQCHAARLLSPRHRSATACTDLRSVCCDAVKPAHSVTAIVTVVTLAASAAAACLQSRKEHN